MADENQWKIAGGVGIDPDPRDPNQPVILQGIGYPLRPVDNVPLTNAPNLEDVVEQGLFMQWMGVWSAGKYYPKGAYVTDSGYACVANKLTLDKPAPVPSGPATFSLPTPWVGAVEQSNQSVVKSGQVYTIGEAGWIKRLRIQVPELLTTTNYRIIIFDETDPDNITSTVIEEPVLVEADWSTVALLNEGVRAGTKLRILIDALNSGSDTSVDGGWTYQGSTPAGTAPIAQNWTVNTGRTSFRINKVDLDGTDRSTELESVIPDTGIAIVQTTNVGLTSGYRVTTVIDQGTYMEFGVVLQNETGGGPQAGQICSIEIDIPIPLPTKYEEQTGVWGISDPTWASSVEGFLEFDGVDQGVPVSNAYGVDIEFEPASLSEDWDIVSFTE